MSLHYKSCALFFQSLVTELGEGNAFVDRLESDSRNIVSLVRDSYNVSLNNDLVGFQGLTSYMHVHV